MCMYVLFVTSVSVGGPRKPGRMSQLEFGNHNFNNWLLARMLDGGPEWDPGRRITVSSDWSNADPKMRMVRRQTNTLRLIDIFLARWSRC